MVGEFSQRVGLIHGDLPVVIYRKKNTPTQQKSKLAGGFNPKYDPLNVQQISSGELLNYWVPVFRDLKQKHGGVGRSAC